MNKNAELQHFVIGVAIMAAVILIAFVVAGGGNDYPTRGDNCSSADFGGQC